MPENFRRKIFANLKSFIKDKEIIVIHGSRQVGKTWLMCYITDQHLKNLAPNNNIFYFDLEDFRLLELCNSSAEEVVSYLKAKGADFQQKIYLLIDEIQYLNNPSSFLKYFYDHYQDNVKLIVSGSSSLLIKRKFQDSLVGRTMEFELFTLDFEEFLKFKKYNYDLEGDLPKNMQEELKVLYHEFVLFGGYPAIVLENETDKKELKLKQIINTYIKKDIRDLAEIRDLDKFNSLVKMVSAQTGRLMNVLELATTLGLAKPTVQEYLFLLENTYIIRRIKPFHRNVRSELSKMSKVFLEDTGLANVLINKAFSFNLDGNLLENSVYSQIRKNIPVENINYWRTIKKQEVDFVIDYIDREGKKVLLAVEVKNMFLNKYSSNLRYFKQQYKQAEIYFCCLDKKETAKDSQVKIIYPWELLKTLNLKAKPGIPY